MSRGMDGGAERGRGAVVARQVVISESEIDDCVERLARVLKDVEDTR